VVYQWGELQRKVELLEQAISAAHHQTSEVSVPWTSVCVVGGCGVGVCVGVCVCVCGGGGGHVSVECV